MDSRNTGHRLSLKEKYSLKHRIGNRPLKKPQTQKQKRGMALSIILPIAVAVVSTSAGIYFNYRATEDSTEQISRALTIAKEALNSQIDISATASMERISKSVTIATKESVDEINRAVSNAKKEMVATVTGGDSFCYISFGNLGRDNVAYLTLVQQGENPLYDIFVRIVDLDKVDKLRENKKYSHFDAVQQATVIKRVSNLGPSQSAILDKWNLSVNGKARYNIFIIARNGSLIELARLKFINGKWVAAYKVDRDVRGNTILLYESIDADYPLDKEGKVDW